MTPTHLVRRFVASLDWRRPTHADEAWAGEVAGAAVLLLRRLGVADRRHAIRGARRVAGVLGPNADPRWVEAALLHDVGKYDAGLGLSGRVGATLVIALRGRRWAVGRAERSGVFGRIGVYAAHDDRGARELAAVGSDPAVVWWAQAHHDRRAWPAGPIPADVVALLDDADRV